MVRISIPFRFDSRVSDPARAMSVFLERLADFLSDWPGRSDGRSWKAPDVRTEELRDGGGRLRELRGERHSSPFRIWYDPPCLRLEVSDSERGDFEAAIEVSRALANIELASLLNRETQEAGEAGSGDALVFSDARVERDGEGAEFGTESIEEPEIPAKSGSDTAGRTSFSNATRGWWRTPPDEGQLARRKTRKQRGQPPARR